MSNISTKLVYLDLKTILENFRNPEFWEKEWLIFKSKEIEAYWSMTSINLLDNKIISCITLKASKGRITRGGKHFLLPYEVKRKSDWGLSDNSCRPIPINHSDYTQEVFERNIFSTLVDTIEKAEKEMIKNTYEYDEAYQIEDDMKEKLREIASDFLDEEGVTNDAIRDAYIDTYVSDNLDNSLTSEIVRNAQFKFFKSLYLHVASWFNREKDFEDYAQKLKKYTSKKYSYAVFKKKQEALSEEWVEEMKNQLESI